MTFREHPEQNQAISIPVTRDTISRFLYLLFCFPSLLFWPMHLRPGHNHVECLEPLVANQQQTEQFPSPLHVSLFSEPKILWERAVKLQTCTKANQQISKQDKVGVIYLRKKLLHNCIINTFSLL